MGAYQDAADFFREFERDPEYQRERAIVRAQTTIAFNINRLRRERGWTQSEVAAKAGMRQPRIAEIERGEYNPRLDTLAKLAWAFGASVEDLARETDSRPVHHATAVPTKLVVTEVVDSPFTFAGGKCTFAVRVDHVASAANNNFALTG